MDLIIFYLRSYPKILIFIVFGLIILISPYTWGTSYSIAGSKPFLISNRLINSTFTEKDDNKDANFEGQIKEEIIKKAYQTVNNKKFHLTYENCKSSIKELEDQCQLQMAQDIKLHFQNIKADENGPLDEKIKNFSHEDLNDSEKIVSSKVKINSIKLFPNVQKKFEHF